MKWNTNEHIVKGQLVNMHILTDSTCNGVSVFAASTVRVHVHHRYREARFGCPSRGVVGTNDAQKRMCEDFHG